MNNVRFSLFTLQFTVTQAINMPLAWAFRTARLKNLEGNSRSISLKLLYLRGTVSEYGQSHLQHTWDKGFLKAVFTIRTNIRSIRLHYNSLEAHLENMTLLNFFVKSRQHGGKPLSIIWRPPDKFGPSL